MAVTNEELESYRTTLQEEIDKGPFKGYLVAKINPWVPMVYLNSIVSSLRYENRERAYLNVFHRLDELEHQFYLKTKRPKNNPPTGENHGSNP